MKGACFMAFRLILAVLAVGALPLCGQASESETNIWCNAARRLSFSVFADIESAYWARGAIVDKHPFSAQFVGTKIDLDPVGSLGCYAWSVSSLSREGQSAARRNFYNEVDYCVYYGYELKILDEVSLDSNFGPKWVTLPGYRPHANTMKELNVWQSLKNPYVTPYYLLRWFYQPEYMYYWDVGLTRSWELLSHLTLTVTAFGELGDSDHFMAQYGANPHSDGRYSSGLMALNLMVRFDYSLTEWLGIYAFVHQFDIVSSDARAALDRDTSPQSLKDMMIFGLGMSINF